MSTSVGIMMANQPQPLAALKLVAKVKTLTEWD
jgi:hypothetical protein